MCNVGQLESKIQIMCTLLSLYLQFLNRLTKVNNTQIQFIKYNSCNSYYFTLRLYTYIYIYFFLCGIKQRNDYSSRDLV